MLDHSRSGEKLRELDARAADFASGFNALLSLKREADEDVAAAIAPLLARATPERSGDHLAGVAAGSAEERAAAQMSLANVPLRQFLNEAVVPYEDDEVTRLIVDTHDAAAFAAVA